MEHEKYDSFLIMNPENIYYVSGFTGTSGYLFISTQENFLITDFRYTKQASEQSSNFKILECKDNIWNLVMDIINKYNIKNMVFESHFITYNKYIEMCKVIKDIELIPMEDFIEKIRAIKNKDEISLIEKAAQITDEAFDYILGIIKPGITEKDIAFELEYYMRKRGADSLSFDTIVASGYRSALPHGVAGDKKIENGDLLTLDFGCRYKRYCSDMTRTVVVGNVREEQRKIYQTVYNAQKLAKEYIKAGLSGEAVDMKAREIINLAGYKGMFGHGLGHGVGLEVHEAPRLAPGVKKELKQDMVVTIEPGIYINNFGGVRIEDLVVVTKEGCKELSNSTRELLCL